MDIGNPAVADGPQISVIIPTLNEADALAAAIAAIRTSKIAHEILVVDAQSSDETVAVAQASGARVISSSLCQRAQQLNLGARAARGSILIFVHADTLLPTRALDRVVESLRDPQIVGGGFVRRYASHSLFLRATCLLARCRNRTLGWHLGDQAMFARASVFFQLGGFPETSIFEDLEFSRRLKRLGRVVTLTPAVTTSARRFAAGPVRTTGRDLGLTIGYLLHGLPVEPPRASVAPPLISSPRRLSSGLLARRG